MSRQDSTSHGISSAEPTGAESSGPDWRVYPRRDKGVLVAHILVVTVAPNIRKKERIPAKYDSPELRARWAVGAAEGTKALYHQEELAAKAANEPKTPAGASPTVLTFQEVSGMWTSGDLAKDHPDHVDAKVTAEIDISRLKVINKIVGTVPITDAGWIDHARRVMRGLPERVKTTATRRHYAQILHRVLALAVWPLRLIDHNPLPRGFLPKVGTAKAKVYVYPTEDARLMACKTVPLWRRVLWGVLAREGMREGELVSLTWSCLDLERGVLTLDENKTDDPRAWAMNPAVVRALIAWKKVHPNPKPNKPVILEENSGVIDGKPFARLLRADLQVAKVKRAELYLKGKNRLMVRAHDLRGTFVTLSLANERTEAWVQDRTGHTSSNMINLYRRTARTAAELGLGELLPLDEAIPELRSKARTAPRQEPETGTCPGPVPRSGKWVPTEGFEPS